MYEWLKVVPNIYNSYALSHYNINIVPIHPENLKKSNTHKLIEKMILRVSKPF